MASEKGGEAGSDGIALDPRWQFWIDRGGTFTDIVARRPDGVLLTHKLLSDNPEHYLDATLAGIRFLLGIDGDTAIPAQQIQSVKMGTTVATNALLERSGARTGLLITRGFRDALRIAYQNRPRLFDLAIQLPELLYEEVIEVDERIAADGEVLCELERERARQSLKRLARSGIQSVAIVLMHGYRYPQHELALADLARAEGFRQVSTSHGVSPLMKLVARGDTTVVDAYLSPILRRYIDRVASELGDTRLMFMQSNGGLVSSSLFQGKDSILSGPAGGIVGAVNICQQAGYERIIAFDMGGTSTDVSHYCGEFERSLDAVVAGVRMRAPMMQIHTVAAGGGSILHFDGARFRVGPDSAGANPGPACYRRGGPLTITDCNVMLGKLNPVYFPAVFGADSRQMLDGERVAKEFRQLAARIKVATGRSLAPTEVAEGFLRVAVDNMANAIKQISTQRGYDITGYTLCCFGGAGGQHACLVADALGMKKVLLHPLAGVLSAYGMGMADLRTLRQHPVEAPLSDTTLASLQEKLQELEAEGRREIARQGVPSGRISTRYQAYLKYEGTDATIAVDLADADTTLSSFEQAHRQRYGFVVAHKGLIIEAISIEIIGASYTPPPAIASKVDRSGPPPVLATISLQSAGVAHQAQVFQREALVNGDCIDGPAVIIESTGTNVIEPGWQAWVTGLGNLELQRVLPLPTRTAMGTDVDPIMLEVFNNLFMSIAEQMGAVLENTSQSVNVKERLDFSCAVFDSAGDLVANAPHMPVHLGSMSESIKAIIGKFTGKIAPHDVFISNAPYNGGTHLPDITVVTPVFNAAQNDILFYVASRGHHADIGGISPGSMPPDSRSIEEEGVLFDNVRLVEGRKGGAREGIFQESMVRHTLGAGPRPARNPEQNIADLKAQIAANEKGVQEMWRMIEQFGVDVVLAYMGHVQDNAEEAVRRVIDRLSDGEFVYEVDNIAQIRVRIAVDSATRSATVDFTGSSAQLPSNFNAPSAVCKAAVLYVFRTLVDDDIPMNQGCLKPLNIIIPEHSMLNPDYPAAVVAGNVETSQWIVNALYGALGVVAAAQGTMNNFTFGDDDYQYYETICGGMGAGPDVDGTSAIQCHMTNSRLTDPEVLEWRYPVQVESFALRTGSGGAGKHRGGDGVVRRIRFKRRMGAAILSSHRISEPFGLAGGQPGKAGNNAIERADGSIEPLGGTDSAIMEPGDVFVIETPGGGGFGPPDDLPSH
jgi:5-oxoprolinase (ATP-hydrolysing)